MRAVIYSRYSAGPDQTIQSIEGQLRVCQNYIANHGWDFVRYYADEHISGRTDRRPQFQEMISAAERGEFDVLVVYSTDRFSRNKFDSINYKKKLKDLGIKIAYAAENIPEGPEGILLESLMEGWAEYYSEELSRKVKRGMSETARKGLSNGGRRTFGYRTGPDKKIIVDEDEARAVREVFKMIADGQMIRTAVEWLHDNGYVSTIGKPHTPNSVKKMLTNKRYLGIYVWDDIEIPNALPAIIDKPTFFEVQKRFEENKRAMPKNRVKFLLSGKLYCGLCGSPMTGCSGTSKTGKVYTYYRCRKKDIKNISKEELEELVASQTSQFFSSRSELDQIVDMLYYYMTKKNASERDSRVPDMRINDLRRQRENLITVIAQTGNASLVSKLSEVEAALARLEELQEQEKKRKKTFTKEELRLSLEAFLDRVDRLDPETSDRRIIDALVKEVWVYEDRIEIIFNIQIGPDDPGQQKSLTIDSSSSLIYGGPKRSLGELLIFAGGYFGIKAKRP